MHCDHGAEAGAATEAAAAAVELGEAREAEEVQPRGSESEVTLESSE